MLVIPENTQKYFEEVKSAAVKFGLEGNLQKALDYLEKYAGGTSRCTLYKDFAPYSFRFVMERPKSNGEYEYWFNGGLIFHGPHDSYGSGTYPTLSVCIEPTDGWSIHT